MPRIGASPAAVPPEEREDRAFANETGAPPSGQLTLFVTVRRLLPVVEGLSCEDGEHRSSRPGVTVEDDGQTELFAPRAVLARELDIALVQGRFEEAAHLRRLIEDKPRRFGRDGEPRLPRPARRRPLAGAARRGAGDVGGDRRPSRAEQASPGARPRRRLGAAPGLVYGARRSRRRAENLARVDALRRTVQPLPLTDEVVDRYGATRAELESRGVTKSDFDLLIACTALVQDAVLVSSDRALLDGSIAGLRAENWLSATG